MQEQISPVFEIVFFWNGIVFTEVLSAYIAFISKCRKSMTYRRDSLLRRSTFWLNYICAHVLLNDKFKEVYRVVILNIINKFRVYCLYKIFKKLMYRSSKLGYVKYRSLQMLILGRIVFFILDVWQNSEYTFTVPELINFALFLISDIIQVFNGETQK